jgi:hypothetical protein
VGEPPVLAGVMEIATLGVDALLDAPTGKGGVQEGIHAVQSGLDRNCSAIFQIQFYDHIFFKIQIKMSEICHEYSPVRIFF